MKDELLALPQNDDIWIAGAQSMTLPKTADRPEQVVWILIIQSRTEFFVLGLHTSKTQPDPQRLLDTLIETMFEPKEGEPHRPAAIEMGPNLTWDAVVPMLEGIGIAAQPAGTLYDLNTVFQHLSIQMTGKKLPNLPIEPE